MVSVLAALFFSAAFAASFWAMFVTIAPRIGYMRQLLRGEAIPPLAPVTAARARNVTRPMAAASTFPQPVRAAA